MALGKRWSLTFKSLNNTTCNVYIYDDGWTGAVTELIGAADPFEYEEDNDENMLTVLRYRTGYLRVLEPEYGSLADLYPASRFSRYVEFYYGERLDFTGYLQNQNFENDWVASPRVLAFPVVSPLGLTGTMKFPLYTTPTRITLGACMYNILTEMNSHANSASRYQQVVFPDVGPEFTGTINTMVISGFSDQFSHADPDSPVFAAKYFDYFIEGICNAYGWICHDTPDALIFTRYDWNGDYAYYELATLAVPTNKQTVSTVGGYSANKLLDSYTVRDANATEGLIQPMKSLTLNYEGENIESADMDLARTYTQGVIPGGKFGFDSNPEYAPGIVWLKAADNEFTGDKLLDTNSLENGFTHDPGVNLTYSGAGDIGYKERILIGWPNTWTVGAELFQWKIYQPPVGDCNFTMDVSWGPGVGRLGHEARSAVLKFSIWMECGGKYYNFNNSFADAGFLSDSLVSKTIEIDANGKFTLSIADVPVGIMTIGFAVGAVNGPEMVSIDGMTLSRRTFTFAEYTEVQNPTDLIEGSDAGNMEGSVSLSLNCYRKDTHLIGLTPVAEKFTEYPYLFEPMERVVCRFWATDYDVLKNYLGKWRFWIPAWRWRMIAVAFEPWNDLYTLTLHRSPSIESRGYLADVNDNVFQSLDEYLFTVLTDEAPEPPTPVIPVPTITPDAGSILPSATITISVTSPATGAEYSLDNETWIPYSAPFTLASDSTVYARATDGDGNYSEVVSNAYTILPYDAEVEYLKGSGNQYINTGTSLSVGMSIDITAEITTNYTTTQILLGFGSLAGCWMGNVNNAQWGISSSIKTGTSSTKTDISVIFASEQTELTINGTTLSRVRSGTPVGTLTIFTDTTYKCSAKVYGVAIKDSNSNIIKNLIPVRKNGVGYMYDTISGTLFGNSGTGAFTYGNDV